MQPSAIAVDIDSSDAASDFEEVPYPAEYYSNTTRQAYRAEEELPLHYMSEEKARRRVVQRGGGHGEDGPYEGSGAHGGGGVAEKEALFEYQEYDDAGKDVYNKVRTIQPRIASGRLPAQPLPPPTSVKEFLWQNSEHIVPIIYTLFSCWTRYHKIGASNIVVWDEAHFGKFASHYLKREFYFDVHPPLGKMLVGLAGLLSGYNGGFEFKSGEVYPDTVPFVAMRVMMATFGVLMVPLAWYTALELGMSQWAAHLTTLMVLLDVGWLVISRFILLDSMLLFFTFLTVFCLSRFHNEQYDPFSIDWWAWLTFTGISIGCVTRRAIFPSCLFLLLKPIYPSVKMIGLFVTSLVGVYTIEDLWDKFGDTKLTVKEQAKHWAARVLCLIVVPILVFMAAFKVHFLVLNHSGPGDAQMPSLFQANLIGNDFAKNPLEIAYGSKLTLKNMGWGGGLLHSHVQTYPVGSNQQQVTCYHYKDTNNDWTILPRWDEPTYDPEGELRYLQNGDVIRLNHVPTTRNLHSHSVVAPVTKLNYEVSCYGNATIGDKHDYWKVEVVDDIKRGKGNAVDRIHSLTTRLRFKHQVLGCYLSAANAVLPQWGFKQIEVSCDKENNVDDVHTYWNVESHWNDRLPAGDMKLYRSPFLRDFWHLNVAMMTSNNALVPDPDKEDILASKPFDWPLLHLGLRMCGWGDTQIKYYLLGTPVIWWGGTVSLVVGVLTFGWYVLRRQRRYVDMDAREWEHFVYVGKIALFGWFFHFVPFLIMGRVTYLHHYLPTLYFSVLMLAHVLDHFVFSARRLSEKTKAITFGVCVVLLVGSFWWFKSLAFGIHGPIAESKGLRWRKVSFFVLCFGVCVSGC
ncbi:dolichyl-phosphate-mannose-protein mannosyltransferase [Coprinopsis marcescibilis]|uniref:Dolichyl-phosphate-mannose--protein mannosyltransferase n=1 Tax=Coprinopsis marcescibilis TaxID=230819 RepID=A0A5C3KGC6_COPMA|nr:dolichyl-phosphate-mannose-protein mannosyltransferase [Coprinopsis marcescibilis]